MLAQVTPTNHAVIERDSLLMEAPLLVNGNKKPHPRYFGQGIPLFCQQVLSWNNKKSASWAARLPWLMAVGPLALRPTLLGSLPFPNAEGKESIPWKAFKFQMTP